MPKYLFQVSYTNEGIAALVRTPQDRVKAIGPIIENLGGKYIDGGFSFGDHDVVFLASFPDNATAVAASMAFSAGGAVKTVKTTPLISTDEALAAMKKASTAGYKPPM